MQKRKRKQKENWGRKKAPEERDGGKNDGQEEGSWQEGSVNGNGSENGIEIGSEKNDFLGGNVTLHGLKRESETIARKGKKRVGKRGKKKS